MHLKCVVAVTRFQSTEAFSVIADIILLLMPNFIDHSLLLPVVILCHNLSFAVLMLKLLFCGNINLVEPGDFGKQSSLIERLSSSIVLTLVLSEKLRIVICPLCCLEGPFREVLL